MAERFFANAGVWVARCHIPGLYNEGIEALIRYVSYIIQSDNYQKKHYWVSVILGLSIAKPFLDHNIVRRGVITRLVCNHMATARRSASCAGRD